MRVHLVDGTYELFRAYFGAPSVLDAEGRERGAAIGLGRSLLSLLRQDDVTHVAVAFDHTVESFRNELFDGYKTGEGMEPELFDQFGPAESITEALGVVVWPMVEFEADDALCSGAARFADAPDVQQVVICSPDKDLAQCVRGERVVCLDRRRERTLDEDGVREKFGVDPASIPDWLALVGDSADGIPGVPRWGARSASTALAEYGHVDRIPDDENQWSVRLRGAAGLARSLAEHRDEVALYRTLATLRTDVPLTEDLDALRWQGARRGKLEPLCEELGSSAWLNRVPVWRDV